MRRLGPDALHTDARNVLGSFSRKPARPVPHLPNQPLPAPIR